MAKLPPSPHRIVHNERQALTLRPISSFHPGEVFVRAGAPCMRIRKTVDTTPGEPLTPDVRPWIVNLLTGSAWPIDGEESVYPVSDVTLDYAALRP